MNEISFAFRQRVGEILAGAFSARAWQLVVTPHHEGNDATHAGGSGSVSWYQRTANGPLPAVYVVNGTVLMRDYLAIPSLEWKGSLTRLEKIMGTREWIRIPFDLVVVRDPGCLPVVWAMQEFHFRIGHTVTNLGVDTVREVARYEVQPEGEQAEWQKATWELGLVEPSLVIDGWPGNHVELTFLSADSPSRIPNQGEIIDAEEIWAKASAASPRRRPRKPKGYQVSIEESELGEDQFPWTLRDEDLAVALGVQNAVEAEEVVRSAMRERTTGLIEQVTFDSSRDCFFAYAGSTPAAGKLAQLVADLVHEQKTLGVHGGG